MISEILRRLLQSPCILWKYFGIYCPGCGGTRAVKELLKGHLVKSFWYHPLVLYVAVLLGYAVLSHGISYLSKGKYKIGMKMHNRYLYIGIGIILINWIVKNILLLVFGITL